MAKTTPAKSGKSLVIVESPAKARTIAKFLGRDFTVEASIGHVRDLPQGKKEVPEQYKSQDWAYLGVNVDDEFQPIYIVPHDKKQQVAKLKLALKDAKDLYLATDEDREGEAISWHLHEILKPKVPVHRLVFHEITNEAIHEALEHPRQIDEALVRAQETRRILDRLFGYDVSNLLWRKVGPRLSAGRVQSVAVRLIVERERARMAFVSASYWDLLAQFTAEGREFQAALISVDGRKIPSGKDFDPATGSLKDPNLLLLNEQQAAELAERLRKATFRVTGLDNKPYTRKPAPPFTTSTLQQEANRKLGFTARRTMQVAQNLYENGHITYMRTDSTTLAQVAIDAARDLILTEYGRDYLPDAPRTHANKVRNAQEAHEAIRPAGHPFEFPEALRNELGHDQFRLFDLIWKRTIASQMTDSYGHNITITIEGEGAVFQVSGKTIDFAGFLRAYVEGSDDPEAELAERETLLPSVALQEQVACHSLESKSHSTQPPARFTEASLTQRLEEEGIGRPSTYAAIIDTILARDYVFKKGNALVPTWTAFSVVRMLEEHLPYLVDYKFTAQMEDYLDAISRQEAEHLTYLREFYFGNGTPGLKNKLAEKLLEIDPRVVSRFLIGKPASGPHTEEIHVRVGKFGPFLEQGERRASLPDGMAPDELTLVKSLELLEHSAQAEEPLGACPETGKLVYLKRGRFGPYVQLSADEGEKPKNASLLKGMKPEDITLEVALKLLTLPRSVGIHPVQNAPIVAYNGKFGPYIKCGDETRSLPEGVSPLDATLEQSVELLAQPKVRGRGRAAPKAPIKVFPNSPVTEQSVTLLEGRYGPYVTDGVSNASLPKGALPEELTFEQALDLLAERAARGPSTKKARRKGSPKKAAPKKKAAVKKAPAAGKKKAAKKRAPRSKTAPQTAAPRPALASQVVADAAPF